ncbi:MAG: STAS domain-containing protein [Chlamydiia bacterium]|nr:STAS domain-containing protein [Chlamydiia bacterium]
MIGWALKRTLVEYSLDKFMRDCLSGIIVSLVALPLAMALSIAVGLSPQYGLYTAIVAGIVTPLLGGSVHQVSGPTAAFVVILAPIVTTHGMRGLILTTVIAGFILVLAGAFKIGRYIRYIPYPVTTGFTSGIAVVIAILSLNDFFGLGLTMPDHFFDKVVLIFQAIKTQGIHWPEFAVGGISLFVMGISRMLVPKFPAPILGVITGTLVSLLLIQFGISVDTIGTHFQYTLPNGLIGHGVPPSAPVFQFFGFSGSDLFKVPSLQELKILFIPGVVVAALAALESVLSATVADGMAGTKHHPNSELVGIGMSNILCGLASGIPATGAIARTATNIQSGGRTPIASALHGIFILAYVVFFSDLISILPMSSLAAILLITAYRMSHIQQFVRVLKIGPIEDSIALVLCFLFTTCIDMVAGVTVGVITSCFLLVKRLAGITELKVSAQKVKFFDPRVNDSLPTDVAVYHINGSIFFGNVEEILEQIEYLDPNIHQFVIDLTGVPFVDITGMVSLKRTFTTLSLHNKRIIVCAKRAILEQMKNKLHPDHLNIIFEESLESAIKKINP